MLRPYIDPHYGTGLQLGAFVAPPTLSRRGRG